MEPHPAQLVCLTFATRIHVHSLRGPLPDRAVELAPATIGNTQCRQIECGDDRYLGWKIQQSVLVQMIVIPAIHRTMAPLLQPGVQTSEGGPLATEIPFAPHTHETIGRGVVGVETIDKHRGGLEWPSGRDDDVHSCRIGQRRKRRDWLYLSSALAWVQGPSGTQPSASSSRNSSSDSRWKWSSVIPS